VVQHVAAPDPVEGGVADAEGRRVALTELETRGGQRVTDEGAGGLGALGRRLDAGHAAARSHRLGQPDGVEPGAAAHVETARAFGQPALRDDGVGLRLLEAVHPLQRFRERLGLLGRHLRLGAHDVAS
jgi:hypothetical protein